MLASIINIIAQIYHFDLQRILKTKINSKINKIADINYCKNRFEILIFNKSAENNKKPPSLNIVQKIIKAMHDINKHIEKICSAVLFLKIAFIFLNL